MRRSWLSSEFWLSAAAMALIGWQGPRFVALLPLTIMINALATAYILGRVLMKKNRGLVYTGLLASELYWTLFAISCDAWALFHGLSGVWAFGLGIVQVAFYDLCRGVTKHLAPKTTLIL